MFKRSRLPLIVALAAVSLASPAFAQAFNPGWGTGNVTPFAYGPDGKQSAPAALPQNGQIAARQGGHARVAARQDGQARIAAHQGALYDYAGPGFVPPATTPDANDPSRTGGGSLGYNENLYNY